MDIREFLQLLQHVSGPNGNGEYTARCPCHDDKTASLTVTAKASPKDGRERIYFHCHAGCAGESILAKLGLKPVDLIVNPEPAKGGAKPAKPRKKPADPQPAPAKPTRAERPKIDWAHPEAVYSYTDAEGKELFQVCRYAYTQDGKREKTFRQRRYEPQNPDANREGYVNKVPAELRDHTLYKMPEVTAAIRERRPVYVVEGEKDAETLLRLGHAATCNPGGAGKWRESYSRLLAGADIIILPDNDTSKNEYAGQNHALDVALKSRAYARRVRLVDIKEACPELPEKGDISDMVKIMGETVAMDALARQVAATQDFDPSAVPFWLTPTEQAERLYRQVPGYAVANGCIGQITNDGARVLADFVVIPRMELTRDDGVNASMWFVLDGWSGSGRRLPRVTISSKELDAMNWVTAKWGFSASLAPGTATKDKVSWAIKKVGQLTAKRVTEYNHTGWRKIEGKWCYLYHGGAVGMEGVTVRMNGTLSRYHLDGNGSAHFKEISFLDGAEQSIALLRVMKKQAAVALLCTMYLAPLREFFEQADLMPSYVLFFVGRTQTHKTTAATLALSHFGNFNVYLPKPASFSDTASTIRGRAFALKDMPYLIDDYHPVGTPQEKRQMIALAQSLSRAFGDGAERGRMNPDGTIKPATPPRCLSIITGEDVPETGESSLARFYTVKIRQGDIPITRELTDLQEAARKGYLQKSMYGYIKWLQAQANDLPDYLDEMFSKIRRVVNENSKTLNDRAPDTIAYMMVGYQMMLNYFRDIELLDTETASKMFYDGLRALIKNSEEQSYENESEKPSRMYLSSMAELIASKTVMVKLASAKDEGKGKPTDNMIGYFDKENYYFLSGRSYAAVMRMFHEQGREFPISQRGLYTYLEEDGVITKQGKDYTEVKWLDGRSQRVLKIPRRYIDGEDAEPSAEQTRMDFTEVEDPDLPEGWKKE